MVNYAVYPICDTSILINLKLIEKFEDFIKHKKCIFVADKVRDELFFKYGKSKEYKHFLDILNLDSLILIEENLFNKQQLSVIKRNLLSYNISDVIGTNKRVPDMGEFVSAFYAVELGINKLYIDDVRFINGYSKEPIFKNIKMIQIRAALSEFLRQSECIKCMSIIGLKNKKMDDELQREKLLEKFGSKYNKSF